MENTKNFMASESIADSIDETQFEEQTSINEQFTINLISENLSISGFLIQNDVRNSTVGKSDVKVKFLTNNDMAIKFISKMSEELENIQLVSKDKVFKIYDLSSMSLARLMMEQDVNYPGIMITVVYE